MQEGHSEKPETLDELIEDIKAFFEVWKMKHITIELTLDGEKIRIAIDRQGDATLQRSENYKSPGISQ